MNVEEQLQNIKKVYIKTKPNPDFTSSGWPYLAPKLKQGATYHQVNFPKIVFASLIFLLLGTLGTVTAAQKSLPGQPLYPLKIASENLIVALSNNHELKINRRAQEVINLAKQNDPHNLKEASENYQQEVEQSGKKVPDQNKQKFQNQLQNQVQEFKETIKVAPQETDQLENAINAAQKAQSGEVKGIKGSNKDKIKD